MSAKYGLRGTLLWWGLSDTCLLITHFIFKILTTPQIQYFLQFSQNFKHIIPPFFIQYKHLKTHPKILKKLLNQGLQLNEVIC